MQQFRNKQEQTLTLQSNCLSFTHKILLRAENLLQIPAIMELNLLNLVQTYGLDKGIAIFNGSQERFGPGDWLERSNSCESVYSQPESSDISSKMFSMAVIFNNATNQPICSAVVITKGYLLTTVQGLMVKRGNGSDGM